MEKLIKFDRVIVIYLFKIMSFVSHTKPNSIKNSKTRYITFFKSLANLKLVCSRIYLHFPTQIHS